MQTLLCCKPQHFYQILVRSILISPSWFRWASFEAEEDLDFSSFFELFEGDTPPFTSLESYEYGSDSDLEDDSDNHSGNHNNLAVVQPAEELATGDEASASHDERSHTPESPEGLFICWSFHLISSMIKIRKIRLILSQSRLSPTLKVLKRKMSHVCRINIFIAELQEQPNNRPLLSEGVGIIDENLKRGFRVVLVKGVAWRT
jgi:hypothetical protein